MRGVARTWHGSTSPENADAFEHFLRDKVFPDFEKSLKGYHGAQLLRRKLDDHVEFMTIMWFDSMDSVRLFAGDDYETAHIDPNVEKLLWQYSKKSIHSDVCFSSI